MRVYDAEQDGDKDFFRRVREGLIGALAWILENRTRGEVGTKVSISGGLDSPQFNSCEAVAGFLENAFVKAIAPGLETKSGRTSG